MCSVQSTADSCMYGSKNHSKTKVRLIALNRAVASGTAGTAMAVPLFLESLTLGGLSPDPKDI